MSLTKQDYENILLVMESAKVDGLTSAKYFASLGDESSVINNDGSKYTVNAVSTLTGAFDCTSRATAVLRGVAGFSLGFGLVRDFTDRVSTGTGRTLSGRPRPATAPRIARGPIQTIPQ